VKRDTKIIAALLAVIPIVILSSALLCTFAIAHGASMNWRLLFRVMCHGMPSRCLTVWNVPMPICARCAAIYSGLFAGVAFFAIARVRVSIAKVLLIASSIAMAIDGLTQVAGLRESTNPLRIATGLAVGIAFGIWALATMEKSAESVDAREFNAS
jgi:uncharacterized membrane protein